MRTGISILVVVLLAGAIGIACTPKNPSITEIDVLQDVTDTRMIRPNTDEILSLYTFRDKWNGTIFRFTDITDVSINKTFQAKLETENQWLSNEMDRDKEIETFRNKVTGIITQAGKDNNGKPHSAVYLPVARELNHLSESKANRKVLLVYSDLMENTRELSFYQPQDINRLKKSPEVIREKFEKQLLLNSLSGIEVYFIYQPSGDKSDEDFQIISEFYRKLLTEKGARVIVSANINL